MRAMSLPARSTKSRSATARCSLRLVTRATMRTPSRGNARAYMRDVAARGRLAANFDRHAVQVLFLDRLARQHAQVERLIVREDDSLEHAQVVKPMERQAGIGVQGAVGQPFDGQRQGQDRVSL